MNEKKHIVCNLCTEPECLEEDCIFHTYPHEIAQGVKSLTQSIKGLTKSPKSLTTRNKNPIQGTTNLIDFRYLPAYFRGGKTVKPLGIRQEKKYIVCYLCDEPQCLDKECIFLTDPQDITRGLKKYINLREIRLDTGKSKATPLNVLYLHGVKLFWFIVVCGGLAYIFIFGGLRILSTTFFGMPSQLPLQFYLSIFGAGVTIVCLVMANLFGTESTTAK